MTFHRISIRQQRDVLYVNLVGPSGESEITGLLISELEQVLFDPELTAKIVVLEGTQSIFCIGADLKSIVSHGDVDRPPPDPDRLYRLWLRLAYGPFVSIAHVQGQTAAGGVGFVAACDIALATPCATFGLSELLFGLFPACVLPFLERRIGTAKAHYMTLTTLPFEADKVLKWGLLDDVQTDSADLLRRHLLRLNHISTHGIADYKAYQQTMDTAGLVFKQAAAVQASHTAFSKPSNQQSIARFLSGLDADDA